MKHKETAHELNCFTNAVGFTAVRGRGAQRNRQDFASFDAAKTYAIEQGDGRTMIYAVTANGSSAHITNA